MLKRKPKAILVFIASVVISIMVCVVTISNFGYPNSQLSGISNTEGYDVTNGVVLYLEVELASPDSCYDVNS